MKTWHWVLIGVGVYIVIGFVLGLAMKTVTGWPTTCTEMACLCEMNPEADEIPCNKCSSADPVFYTVVFNVFETCSGRQIVSCPEGRTVRIEKEECSLHAGFFN